MAARHAHQWLAPGEPPIRFDLVPAGSHLGASGNPFDQAALGSAERLEIEPGIVIRHASAPGFLALKLAAYRDRGEDDPFVSHDLEDILALLASRPGIVAEAAAAPVDIRTFIAARVELLVGRDDLDDLVAGHLGNIDRRRAAESIASVHRSLAALAALRQ